MVDWSMFVFSRRLKHVVSSMNSVLVRLLFPTALAVLVVSGCSTYGVQNPKGSGVTVLQPEETGKVAGTGIESQDLVAVTDKMARGIVGLDRIKSAGTPPNVVLLPVENETRFAINKDLFNTRIRAQLNQKASGKVNFLARERLQALEKERELKQQGALTGGTIPGNTAFAGADYFLTGKLSSLTTKSTKGVSDYVLYTFQLIDAQTSSIVWEDFSEIKKQGQDDAAYR